MSDILVRQHDKATKFGSFSSLPREIRDEIWLYSLPPPRLLVIHAQRGEIEVPGRRGPPRPYSHVWAKKTPVPVILQVCRESRIVGLRNYELVFDTNPRPAKEDLVDIHDIEPPPGIRSRAFVFPFNTKAPVYVNLERDIVVAQHGNSYRPPRGGWPRRDPSFPGWPLTSSSFKIDDFKAVVPKDTRKRIRNLAIQFRYAVREIFPVRSGIGMGSNCRILVVKDPFLPRDGDGNDYIDGLRELREVPVDLLGRVRSLKNQAELAEVVAGGTLWDSVHTSRARW